MVFAYAVYLGLLVLSVLAVVGGVLHVRTGFRRWQQATALVDVPVASLDAVAVGEAAVEGTLRTEGRPVSVPVGDERCALYDLVVEDSTDAEPVYENREWTQVYVADDTGRVRLDPGGATLDLSDDRTESFSFRSYDEVPERARTFHRTTDLPDRGMRRDRTIEYGYLRPGDEVYAYGRVRPDDERVVGADEKAVVLEPGADGLVSDKSPEELLRDRRHALAKAVGAGGTVATAGLAAFLWLSGIAQLFLGA